MVIILLPISLLLFVLKCLKLPLMHEARRSQTLEIKVYCRSSLLAKLEAVVNTFSLEHV